MNNITFGDDAFGHYETVAGGAGAVSIDRYRYIVHSHRLITCTNISKDVHVYTYQRVALHTLV